MVEREQLIKSITVSMGDEYRCIDLYIVENGNQKKIDLEDTISMTCTDGSWVAEMLLMRLMMRAANMKLKGTQFEKEGLYRWNYIIDGYVAFLDSGEQWSAGEIEFYQHFQIISGKHIFG